MTNSNATSSVARGLFFLHIRSLMVKYLLCASICKWYMLSHPNTEFIEQKNKHTCTLLAHSHHNDELYRVIILIPIAI